MTDKLDSPFDKEQAPRVSRLWSLACLGISAIAYWPATMIGDMLLRGTSLGRALGYSNENPLDDVDGPEFVLFPPLRQFWLYDRTKPGHRGFLPSLLGTTIGTPLASLFNSLLGNTEHISMAKYRSKEDRSYDKDTVALFGKVVDRKTGEPIRDAVIYAWGADPRGPVSKYGDLDLDFDFRGKFKADSLTGKYALGLLYPVSIGAYSAGSFYVYNAFFAFIPGLLLSIYCKVTGSKFPDFIRPPHVHFYVSAPGYKTLCTQLYFADRLASGEFNKQLDQDVAHPKGSPVTVTEGQMMHPVLREQFADKKRGELVGLPVTRWVQPFDFVLDRRG